MSVAARLYRDSRSAERNAVQLDSTLRDGDWSAFDTVVEDLSATGFRAPRTGDLSVGDLISLGLSGIGTCTARVVRVDDASCGCEFVVPLTAAELAIALGGSTETIVPFPTASSPWARTRETTAFAPPYVKPYSRRTKLGVAVGLAAASWLALFVVAIAVV